MSRQDDFDRFYHVLDDLEERVGGARKLKNESRTDADIAKSPQTEL